MSMKIEASKIIGASCAAAVAFLGVSYLTFHEVMYRKALLPPIITKITLKQEAKKEPEVKDDLSENVEWFDNQHFEEYTLKDSKGENLRGYFLRADKPSNVFVFCVHGYRSNARMEFNYMTKFHHDMGRNVFLIDHQAAGESDGNYIGFGYHEYINCLKWLEFLNETFGNDIQIILHGVSMGSATVMMMSGSPKLPENVKFTIADCGYTSALDEFKYILKKSHVPAYPLLSGADFFNKEINGFHFKDVNALESVSHSKVPMLFIHGKTDTFVPTYMVNQLYDACSSEDKDLLLVDGAWHAESYRKDPEAYEAKVNQFAEKFIEKEPETVKA